MRMTPQRAGALPDADWLSPSVDQPAISRYLATIRQRLWLIVAVVLVTTAAAAAYSALAQKQYHAEADLLVTPVPADDPTLSGLGLIRESSDPTLEVETAARLVTGHDVAAVVKQRLNDPRSADSLLSSVQVAPVAQSNIVSITASASAPQKAATLANAFATAAVDIRTLHFHQQLDQAIAALQDRINRTGGINSPTNTSVNGSESLAGQLVRLETLRGSPDPTMRLETRATPPPSPSSPRPKLDIAGGIIAGLILGIGGAFALQVLDPRVRREEQLRSLYGLPILARIPKDRRGGGHSGALPPEQLAPATIESYRTLRATLAATRVESAGAPVVLVTSASASEGKTTTAINLASSLALAGNRVILIEADLRRPAVGSALGVQPAHGTGSVLLETVSLRDALVTTSAYGNYLQLLLAEPAGAATGWMADRLFLPAAQQLVVDAKEMADYVIIDSPPLADVIDALPLAQRADEVLVVVRLGKTLLGKLERLAELLARHAIRPVGFAIVGVPGAESHYYSPQGQPSRKAQREVALPGSQK
jgi:Mrp family chromosome partitioning ATPase/capsular polysaccharide biosynthesis protein